MYTHRTLFVSSWIGLSLFVLLTACQPTYAQKSARLIESVDVQGNRRISDEDILDYVKTRPNQPYNAKQLQRDLQAILVLGYFDKMQTRVLTEIGVRGGVAVIFEVMELLLILEVKFEGLKYVAESDVVAALREKRIGVMKEAVYDPIRTREAMHLIKELLASRGWLNSTVEVREDIDSFDSVKLTFVIDEQP